MDVAELAVRESVRDLVARYNAYGDTGRLDEVAGLFIDDGVLVVGDHDGRREFRGRAAIADFLRTVKDHWAAEATADSAPSYARHFVSTHVIDILDDRRARGRAYVALVKAAGLVSWGRYVDEYVADDGVWRFASRRALADTASGAAGALGRGRTELPDIVQELLGAVAARDSVRAAGCFADDAAYWTCVPRPPYRGRAAIEEMFARLNQLASKMEWRVTAFTVDDVGTVWLEHIDHFTIDGRECAMECVGVIRFDQATGLIGIMRDYCDMDTWLSQLPG